MGDTIDEILIWLNKRDRLLNKKDKNWEKKEAKIIMIQGISIWIICILASLLKQFSVQINSDNEIEITTSCDDKERDFVESLMLALKYD